VSADCVAAPKALAPLTLFKWTVGELALVLRYARDDARTKMHDLV
jgi:hypothetical protein